MTIKKTTSIVLLVLLAALAVEVFREVHIWEWKLEGAEKKIRAGMTKEQVRQLAGEPDSVTIDGTEEIWFWTGRNHQGWVRERLGLIWHKGHFELSVIFNQENKATAIRGEVF